MTPARQPHIYGYSRVSTVDQATSGLGVEAQRASIEAEAQRHGWNVDHRNDNGYSGTIAPENRPALGAILDEVRPGDVLIVARLDRLGRSALDILRLADRTRREGWRLVACDLGLDTGTPIGAFTLQVLAAVAELERNLIAERTRSALAAKKAQGYRLGRPVTLPDDVRHRIAEMSGSGESLNAIADTLTTEKVATAHGGKRWYASTVKAVLDSLDRDTATA